MDGLGKCGDESRRHNEFYVITTSTHLPHDKEAARLYRTAFVNREEYAQLHGYTAMVAKGKWSPSDWKAYWDKIKQIQHTLELAAHYKVAYDPCVTAWVWWLDADALITNMTLTLEDIVQQYATANTDVLIANDTNGFNAGSMLFRLSDWTFRLLHKVIEFRHMALPNKEQYNYTLWPEQSAIQYYHDQTEDGKSHITLVPMKVFNSYPQMPSEVGLDRIADLTIVNGTLPKYGHHYRRGDFVLHFVASFKRNASKYLKAWGLPPLLRH